MLGKLWKQVKIAVKFQQVTLKPTLIVLVGLTLAVSMVAGALFYLDTNKANFYYSQVEENLAGESIVRVEVNSYNRTTDTNEYFNHSTFEYVNNNINTILSSYGIKNTLVNHHHSPYYVSKDSPGERTFKTKHKEFQGPIVGLQLESEFLHYCTNGSELPTTNSEVLVFTDNASQFTIGEQLNISYTRIDELAEYNYTVTIAGIVTPKTYPAFEKINKYTERDDYAIIIDQKTFISRLNGIRADMRSFLNITDPNTLYVESLFTVHYFFLYTVHADIITLHNVVRVINELKPAMNEMFKELGSHIKRISDSYRISYNTNAVSTIQDQYLALYYLLIVIGFPAMLMAFLTIYFTLGQLNEKRKHIFTLVRMRGVSKRFITIMLLVETVMIASIAFLVGTILSVPHLIILENSRGFMYYTTNTLVPTIVIQPSTLILVFGFSVVSITILNSVNILTVILHGFLGSETQQIKRESPKISFEHLTKRAGFDIFILLQGLLGLMLINWLLTQMYSYSIMEEFMPLVLVLMVVSPLVLLVGAVRITSWAIPSLILKVKQVSWKNNHILVNTISLNLINRKQQVKRTVFLIIIAITFLTGLVILPDTFQKHFVNDDYYSMGADLNISISQSLPYETKTEVVSDLQATQGIVASTLVYHLKIPLLKEMSQDFEMPVGELYMQGINRNFTDTVHWRHQYDNDPLKNLLQGFDAAWNAAENTSTIPLIISKDSARQKDLHVNDTLSTIVPGIGFRSFTFKVVGITTYWPGLKNWYRGEQGDFAITTLDKVKELQTTIKQKVMDNELQEYSYSSEIWCKIDRKYDFTETRSSVTSIISNYSTVPVETVDQHLRVAMPFQNPAEHNIVFFFTFAISNLDYILIFQALVYILIAYILQSYANNKRNLALARSLGMKKRQQTAVIILEPLVLTSVSIFIGTCTVGVLLIGILEALSPMVKDMPPVEIIINIPTLGVTLLCFVGIVIGSSLILMNTSHQQNITSHLKQE